METSKIEQCLRTMSDDEVCYVGGIAVRAGSVYKNERLYVLGLRDPSGRWENEKGIVYRLLSLITRNEGCGYKESKAYLRLKKWSDKTRFFE